MGILQFKSPLADNARIKVVGVGGGGGNAIQNMITSDLREVAFIYADTDVQGLNKSTAPKQIQLGKHIIQGFSTGANLEIGRKAASESVSATKEALGRADVVFIVASMGGGTGSGASPIIAQVARELGAFTVGIVTKPFSFEGDKRKKASEVGLQALRQHVDCLITISNDCLLRLNLNLSLAELFRKANDALFYTIKSISEIITYDGIVGVDFTDVTTILQESGIALTSFGSASGENRARDASHAAITNPFLEGVSLKNAKAILYTITASKDISNKEINDIGEIFNQKASADANIIFNVVFDENAGDVLRITLVATGLRQVSSK